MRMEFTATLKLTPEEEAKLRESLKRCSPETIEAVLSYRKEGDFDAVVVAVHGIIQRYLNLNPGGPLALRPDSTRLGEDLGIDSLTMLEIVMSIEEALNFRVDDADLRNIRTLGDVRQYVDARIHGRPVQLDVVEAYDRDRLCLILPQQPPFLFLDKAEIQGDTVRANYLFRGDEFFFAGHYLNYPVVPASIIYEALGQAGCLWILEQVPARLQQVLSNHHVLFVGMGEARVYKRARPHDEIHIVLTMTRLRAPLAIFDGQVRVNNQLLAKVEGLTLAFGEYDSAAIDATPKSAVVPALTPSHSAKAAGVPAPA
jgi:acyl carrier protein